MDVDWVSFQAGITWDDLWNDATWIVVTDQIVKLFQAISTNNMEVSKNGGTPKSSIRPF